MDAGQQNLRPNDQELGAEQVHILPGQTDCHRFNDRGGRLFHFFRSGVNPGEDFRWTVCHAWLDYREHHQNLQKPIPQEVLTRILHVELMCKL